MKIFFQIWNVLLFIAIIFPAGIIFLKAFGFASLDSGAVGIAPTLSDRDILVASLTLAQAVTTLIMAIFGFMGKYGTCSITALIVLILDIVTMLFTHNVILLVIQSVMIVAYICIARINHKNQ